MPTFSYICDKKYQYLIHIHMLRNIHISKTNLLTTLPLLKVIEKEQGMSFSMGSHFFHPPTVYHSIINNYWLRLGRISRIIIYSG